MRILSLNNCISRTVEKAAYHLAYKMVEPSQDHKNPESGSEICRNIKVKFVIASVELVYMLNSLKWYYSQEADIKTPVTACQFNIKTRTTIKEVHGHKMEKSRWK